MPEMNIQSGDLVIVIVGTDRKATIRFIRRDNEIGSPRKADFTSEAQITHVVEGIVSVHGLIATILDHTNAAYAVFNNSDYCYELKAS